MITFVTAIALLILGYIFYGKFVEKVFGADPKRPTPVKSMADGVDYVELPPYKVFLIQFLNIAGLGPIFGAIMGIMFGPAAFLWIVFGTIFAGAVHDYMSGMMSLRSKGQSLPEIAGNELGKGIKMAMRVFALLLLVLLGAVFVYNPADLLADLTNGEWLTKMVNSEWLTKIVPDDARAMVDQTKALRYFWIIIILAYYIAATLLPVDKIIGKFYPILGFALLFMALGIMVMLFVHAGAVPEVWDQFYNHKANPDATPIFPMMFVTIACGAISGFHATQSPLMARCMSNEKYGRPIFYGAMISEGIVALIWAAAAVAFTGGYEQLINYIGPGTPAVLVKNLSVEWLGTLGGVLAVLGVVAAPITSGDTALRSARLIAADFMHIEQHSLGKRLLVGIPVLAACVLIMMLPYDIMWRYFAWCNQVLATFTLWAISVWLARHDKLYIIALLPALFMTMVVSSYIFYAPEGIGLLTDRLMGISPTYYLSIGFGAVVTLICLLSFFNRISKNELIKD